MLGIGSAQAQSAGIRPEQTRPMANLEQGMEQQRLSSVQLSSFQARACQKIQDVEGYIEIMRDNSLDKGFRERAEELAKQAFWLDENFNSFIQLKKNKGEIQQVEMQTSFQPLQSDPMGFYYSGSLKLIFSEGKGTASLPVFLIKYNKSFGKESLAVWEISFGGE